MQKNNLIVLILCISVVIFSFWITLKNPDCPFHVDYAQYTRTIQKFYDKQVIEGNVNGKYVYTYLMAVLLTPFHNFGFNLFNSLVFVTSLFQALLIWLFYIYIRKNDFGSPLPKVLLMATTLTFLTFIGHPETAMISSVFLMLYFINRSRPYSEFFIAIASFIRIDSAVYYLFARKWTALLPMSITFLQWLNKRDFVQSDLGINNAPFSVFFMVAAGYGIYLILLAYLAKPKDKLDFAAHIFIIAFMAIFLETPSQKIFFFPTMLSFMLYDIDFPKLRKQALAFFIIFNVMIAFSIQIVRAEHCTPKSIYEFATKYDEGIYFGVLQPYLDYYNLSEKKPFVWQLSAKCNNAKDFFIAEDWRNSQVLYWPYKFCLRQYNESDHKA